MVDFDHFTGHKMDDLISSTAGGNSSLNEIGHRSLRNKNSMWLRSERAHTQ